MGPLTEEVAAVAGRSVLCWLATCDRNGCPNVSPKEIFAIVDQAHVVIADIASPGSVRNLACNPAVCLSFIDVFVQKGFKLRGSATVFASTDPNFSSWATPLTAMTGGRFPLRGVIVVEVHAVEAIVAPSYRLFPGEVTEASQIESAMRRYGVRPVAADR